MSNYSIKGEMRLQSLYEQGALLVDVLFVFCFVKMCAK